MRIERGDFPSIPVEEVQKTCAYFAAGLEQIVCDYMAKSKAYPRIESATDKNGVQIFWCEPRIPGVDYSAATWELNEERVFTKYIEAIDHEIDLHQFEIEVSDDE